MLTIAPTYAEASSAEMTEHASEGSQGVAQARAAQPAWAATPLRDRLTILRILRHAIAEHGMELATAIAALDRPISAAVVSEVLPLADAIRFIERRAPRLLRPRRAGSRGRPSWLFGSSLTIHREPLGVVLIVAPRNYPLLLPGVQAMQALAAGNAVVVKAAPGCAAPMLRLRKLASAAGLAPALLTIVDGGAGAVYAAANAGVDHVVFTGSAPAGRSVLAHLAPLGVPATMELSGCDAAFVLPRADLALAARALAFAFAYNGGATCIAPRRCFVPEDVARELELRLSIEVASLPPAVVPVATARKLADLVDDALGRGARLVAGRALTTSTDAGAEWVDNDAVSTSPLVLSDCRPTMRLLSADLFAPVLSIIPVPDIAEAVRLNDRCPYALGATVFGPEPEARAVADRINAGVIVINDSIVPTADPRLPFGGRKASGFGVTRGAEGLLAMTRPKAIVVRAGRFRPHYDPPRPGDERLFDVYLRAAHGRGIVSRLRAALAIPGAMLNRQSRCASVPFNPVFGEDAITSGP